MSINRMLAASAIGCAVLHLVLTVVMSQSERDWSLDGARPASAGWDAIAVTVPFALLAVVAWRTGVWSRGLRAVGVPATAVGLVVPVFAVLFALDPNSDSRVDMFNVGAWALIVTVTLAGLALLMRAPWSTPTRLSLVPACAVLPAGLLMSSLDDSTGWYALQVLAALAVALPAARVLVRRPA